MTNETTGTDSRSDTLAENTDHDDSLRSENLRTDGAGASARDDVFTELAGSTSDSDEQFGVRDKLRLYFRVILYEPWLTMKHDWRAICGLTIVTFYVIMGVVGSRIIPETRTGDGPTELSWFQAIAHPLGTDPLGQDILALTVHSTTPLLKMMLGGALFVITVGVVTGITAGYKGGTVDTILSTFTDIFINIPGLPLVIVLAAIFRPENPYLLGILLSIASWAGLARALRSQVLQSRHESFVEASRAIGVPQRAILIKDILPALLPYIVVNTVSAMRGVLFSAVGLYFLGVLPFSDTNWGIMLNDAYNQGALWRPQLFHYLMVPTIAIVGISMGLILLAQSLDRVFNPRVREKHKETADDPEEETATGTRNTLGT